MSRGATSLLVFGIYLIFLGLTLIVSPNTLLGLFALPATSEVWIRIVGMLVFLLSFYYIMAARKESTEFFMWTVYARASVIVFFTAFVLLQFVKPVLILFGAADLFGALWTAWAVSSDRKAATA